MDLRRQSRKVAGYGAADVTVTNSGPEPTLLIVTLADAVAFG